MLASATVDGDTLRYGTDDYYYGANWYTAKLTDFPMPGDQAGSDYSLLTGDNISLALEDTDVGLMSYDTYWLNTVWTVTLVTVFIYPTGDQAQTFVRQMTCTSWTRQPGQIELQLEDLSSTILEKLYPEHLYNADGRAVTFTIATDKVNLTAHGYSNNDTVEFSDITATTGISVDTSYYVINKTDNNFELSLTSGGSKINLTGSDGTGVLKSYPEILDTEVGRPVPIVTGFGVKVPCALINNNDSRGPWIYGVCESLSGWYYSVDAVYRGGTDGGTLVDASEYTVSTYVGPGYTLISIEFDAEQTDYSGAPYTIWADVVGDTDASPLPKFNAVTEISRLLTWAGLTPDSTSFAAAEAIAATNNMYVDWCYARDGNQTTLKALLDKLLLVARGQIYRADDGEWEIWQDIAGTAIYTYDENENDLIEVTEYRQEPLPANVKLAYQPDTTDPDKLKHTLSRTIASGIGDVLYEAEMIRDFTAADYLHDYLTARLEYGKTAKATIWGMQHSFGEIITIANSYLWSGNKNWIIRGIQRGADNNELDLIEYNAAVYTYVAGTMPGDGNTDPYGTDYSQTLPDAPTAFTVTASGVEAGSDGIYRAYVSLTCTPPPINWSKIYFGVSDGTSMIEGIPSGANYIGTLRNLIPGKTGYTLIAWAENAYGLSGLSSVSNYATISSYTAAADSTAPAAPAAPTVTQGTGKSVDVKWVALSRVTYPDLAGYILKRATSAGGSYTEIWRGDATAKNDNTGLSYSGTYYYKLASYDYSGNESADSSASSGVTVNYISGGSSGEVRNIDAVNITAGTLTGRTVQTSSGNTRVEMSAANNQVNVYDGGTNWASFGYKTVSGSDWVILDCGTGSYTKYAARFYNNNATIATVTIDNAADGNALLVSNGNVNVSSGTLTVSGQISGGTMATTGSGDITAGGDIISSSHVYVGGTSGVDIYLSDQILYFVRRSGDYNGRYLGINFAGTVTGNFATPTG